MNGTGVKRSPVVEETEVDEPGLTSEDTLDERESEAKAKRQAQILRLLWERRRSLLQAAAIGFFASTLIAFLIPKSYTSTSQLMPPDAQSASGVAMMASMVAKTGGDVAGMAGDLLGLKSSGALFVGVLRSQTAQYRLIRQFGLQQAYGTGLIADARARLDENTSIAEDRKSGIITIRVTDRSPQRAAALANAYADELNSLVSELSTSSAHRERVFLEQRLKVAKEDLDDAANRLAQFSSKNNTLDIQIEGKAMLDTAGTIAGQMIAVQSELEGLRQIYTENNPRVRALKARVLELRKHLDELGGAASGAEQAANPKPESSNGMPYPTIRSLPLLGAKYADFYRSTKIQETVFEMLTEQYELAKVEEAKETPTVKVLDRAEVPERKSFPPRILIMFFGTFLLSLIAVVWILGAERWRAVPPDNPHKILAGEITAVLKARAPWASPNGNASETTGQKIEAGIDNCRPRSGEPDQR